MELSTTDNLLAFKRDNSAATNASKFSISMITDTGFDYIDFNASQENVSRVNTMAVSNPSSNDTEIYYDLIKQPMAMVVILSVSYSIIFCLALLGNLSVVLAVVKDKSLHTATNFLLVNMAVADMVMAIVCLPLTLMSNIFFGKFILCT